MRTLLFLLFPAMVVFNSCNTQNNSVIPKGSATEQPAVPQAATSSAIFEANTTTEIGKNILSLFQDRNGNYWFGTQNMGVYRYDGKTIVHFTEKDGLSNNQVQTIQEDKSGNIWFGTGGFEVCRFDGRTFTTLTLQENLGGSNGLEQAWKLGPEDLWFYAGGGVYRYNGHSFAYLPLPKAGTDARYSQNPPKRLGPYGVYCTLKDTKGNLWLGTQSMGVCRYDGNSFTWFTEKGLAGPAVLGLFEDRNGNLWFGNNGSGLFRYDGKSLTNFTEEKGLGNAAFLKKTTSAGKANPGTLARIYTINEDNYGDLWIGTVDAGVWRYDGKNLTNFTTKDGLPSNAVTTIYKDKTGELWFGTDLEGVYKFNGEAFARFSFK